jgi:UDP-N-acetylglucosamine--N-acetylmuramyl-(pentapeptide) pyrophosphoryl-undecaprenol N-acetylglucosamine transferase
MHYAFMAADVVVSRSGAIALAEICAMAKPSILVPYPFAAEDHQTKNADTMVESGASLLIKDGDAKAYLVDEVIKLAGDEAKCKSFGAAAKMNFFKDADLTIANMIIDQIKSKHD